MYIGSTNNLYLQKKSLMKIGSSSPRQSFKNIQLTTSRLYIRIQNNLIQKQYIVRRYSHLNIQRTLIISNDKANHPGLKYFVTHLKYVKLGENERHICLENCSTCIILEAIFLDECKVNE